MSFSAFSDARRRMTPYEQQLESEIEAHAKNLQGPRDLASCRALLRECGRLHKEEGSASALRIQRQWQRYLDGQLARLRLRARGALAGNNVKVTLKELQERAEQEADKMEASRVALAESSAQLQAVESRYQDYQAAMTSAKALLGNLRRMAESDSRLVFWAFVFFLVTCGYIAGKRTRTFSIVFTISSWIFIRPMRVLFRVIGQKKQS